MSRSRIERARMRRKVAQEQALVERVLKTMRARNNSLSVAAHELKLPLTVCPSVGPAGDWGSRQGEDTLERTYAWLVKRGVRRVYLGGLSNGGVGASVLVRRAAHPGLELRGLLLISGAETKAPLPRVPMLLVEGKRDTMMPARLMREFARRAGRLATYVEVDSGHFAFLDRHEACEKAIASWLLDTERTARP